MNGLIMWMNYILGAIAFITTIACLIVIDMWINRVLNLEQRWQEELRNRASKWLIQCKKKRLLHRIDVNRYKLKRLADVEPFPTPEMVAIVNHIKNDVNAAEAFVEPEPTDMEKAVEVTKTDIELGSQIFDKIDEMILLETQTRLLPIATLGNLIDVRDYGDYVKDVASATKDGLNLGVYKTKMVTTPEYINSYIVKKTTIVVLTTITNLNNLTRGLT